MFSTGAAMDRSNLETVGAQDSRYSTTQPQNDADTEIIGESTNIKLVLKQVEMVAATNSTVLILGETGTGKELIARRIHELSARRGRGLVRADCASIPAGLLESELFGHEKGALHGSRRQEYRARRASEQWNALSRRGRRYSAGTTVKTVARPSRTRTRKIGQYSDCESQFSLDCRHEQRFTADG